MALREDQVRRYSRAILLGPVGGRGQQALLATGARLGGGGPALLTAAAYLAAGGTPIEGPPGRLAAEDSGFLLEASEAEAGAPAAAAVQRAVLELNPDAVAAPAAWGMLAALPGTPGADRPLVAVGTRGERWVVWAAGREACAGCLAEATRGTGPPATGPAAIEAGAMAAVLFQRLLLGLSPPLFGVQLGPDGGLEPLAAPRCTHRLPLPAEVLAQVVHWLESRYPEEGCGVVLDGPSGPRFMALPNAYAAWAAHDPAAFPRDPRSAFLFEPDDWLRLLREADARGERVACIVHSHPEGAASFSSEDRAQAAPGGMALVPGAAYLVAAIHAGRANALAWVTWEGGAFRQTVYPLGE